ncbi:LysR family transcriptional regulator [Xanthobacter sp. TB0136]|uniref:LysR family transcriptional regulator n=1 Tax=Xanthobacter sp. TB0136 TaxID=3459177 RepID=UPI004039668D
MEQNKLIETDDLQAFEAVAAKRNFSQAAAYLGIAQSTVSQRISRLEKRAGRPLLQRTTRSVELTPDGQSMLIYARSILSIAEDARRRLHTPPIDGVLKVGIEDEFATTNLPRLLGIFRSQHPRFEMQFLTGRNEFIHDSLHSGEADIILGKSHGGLPAGEVVWREEMVWVGAPPILGERIEDPVPLITYLGPSITRDMVEKNLQDARRTWMTVAKGSNLLGLLSAAEAGVGVMVIGRNFITPGLSEMPESAGLPKLDTMDYVIHQRPGSSSPVTDSFAEVLRCFVRQFAQEASPA